MIFIRRASLPSQLMIVSLPGWTDLVALVVYLLYGADPSGLCVLHP